MGKVSWSLTNNLNWIGMYVMCDIVHEQLLAWCIPAWYIVIVYIIVIIVFKKTSFVL